MSTEVAVKAETVLEAQPQSESAAIISMIERAARDPAVDIDKMERLLLMRERMEQGRAKTAYLAALAGMQAEMPAAVRRGKGHNGKDYARFEDIIEAIRPVLVKHGFSISYRTAQDDKSIRVTGVLGHKDGHSESTDIVLPADTSGSKNIVQAWGSSTSYGKRYVSLTLLGIATEREDDDGRAAGAGPVITEDQAMTLREMIESVGADSAAFCRFLRVETLSALPAARYDEAMNALKAKGRRK